MQINFLKFVSKKCKNTTKNLKAQVSQLDHDLSRMLEEQTFENDFNQNKKENIKLQGQVKKLMIS